MSTGDSTEIVIVPSYNVMVAYILLTFPYIALHLTFGINPVSGNTANIKGVFIS